MLSTAQLQEAAAAAVKSIGDSSEYMLQRFSTMGAGGMASQNVLRDFQHLMKKYTMMPELYRASVPYWDKQRNVAYMGDMWFLLPHELLGKLVSAGGLDPWLGFEAEVGNLEKTLNEWSSNVNLANHDDVVSMGIWGDSAPYNNFDSLVLFLWNSLSGTCHDRYWVTAFPKSAMCACGCMGRHTFDALFDVMKYSFQSLASGTYPTKRHDGTEFGASEKKRIALKGKAIGCRGACLQARGDWQWHKQCFDQQDWTKGANKEVCFKCPANCADIPFTDPSRSARWRLHPRYSQNATHGRT